MSAGFATAVQVEWLKQRRGVGPWLVVIGALFTPAVVTAVRLLHRAGLPALYASATFWPDLWTSCWESMAIFFLPFAAILICSLVTQVEVRNNAWKQVHALPLATGTIFCAKYALAALMLGAFILLFALGVLFAGFVPAFLVPGVPIPRVPPPMTDFLGDSVGYYIDVLPIVAVQYLLSLRFGNFLVAIGVGFLGWVTALATLSWQLGYVVPYIYGMSAYLAHRPGVKALAMPIDGHVLALAYFAAFTVIAYVSFVLRDDKG